MDHLVNALMDEAIACARHLDKEGMGYSADVVRRAARAISDANREHDQDVARMERAAEAIESLTARCEELERALREWLELDARISERLRSKHGWSKDYAAAQASDLGRREVVKSNLRAALASGEATTEHRHSAACATVRFGQNECDCG